MKRLSLPNYINRTGAQFETTERFLKSTSVINSKDIELKNAGVPLTHIDENTFATSKDELHCFIIGDSGCGKTRRVILPTIRLLAKAGESMVISDPKGELYRTTSNSLAKKGYSVRVLNFRNPSKGNRWNPLGLIDELYHAGDKEQKDKALMMLSDIVDVLQQGQMGKDPFWALAAADVFRGVSLIILEYGNKGELTFENIAITARDIIGKMNNRIGGGSLEFNAFLSSLPKGSPIEQNLSVIVTNATDTRNCIMAEFESMISLYCSQEALMDLFSTSEIDIGELGRKPTALFFILPDDTEALYPIATVFVKQIYSSLISLADEQKDGKLPNRVTFLLDEFANFAKMPSIQSMLTAARSRRIRFVLVCQSMDQLTAKYESSGCETLLANCRTWIYMSCRNLPFLKRLEELVGYYISPYTNERCPLVDIGELQHFDIGQVLILNDRCRPVMGYLPDFSEYDFGEDGTDVPSDISISQKEIERKLFDINKAIIKAKTVNSPIVEKKKQEEKRETDGLRASIFEKLAERQSLHKDDDDNDDSDDDSDNEPKSLDDLISLIDARIAELEAEDSAKEKADVMELFYSGQYLEAAQACVDRLVDELDGLYDGSMLGISTRNNLAFLIRFGEIDISKLKLASHISSTKLLSAGIEKKDSLSLINSAINDIKAKHYKKATETIKSLSEKDWSSIVPFWFNDIWKRKNKHPEGALVCVLAYRCDYRENDSMINEIPEMMEIMEKEYAGYYASEHFRSIDAEKETLRQSVTEQPTKPLPLETIDIDSLLMDDEEDSLPSKSSPKTDSVADIKTQLQKKIQEKLNAHHDDDDDED